MRVDSFYTITQQRNTSSEGKDSNLIKILQNIHLKNDSAFIKKLRKKRKKLK